MPAKLCIDGGVARNVALYLWAPIVDVRCRRLEVHWARMPEAAVDEHRNLGPREHEIRSTTHRSNWPARYSVTKPQAMRGSPQEDLGPGITFSITLHDRSHPRTRCPWRVHKCFALICSRVVTTIGQVSPACKRESLDGRGSSGNRARFAKRHAN
jgi:hypothetical protein